MTKRQAGNTNCLCMYWLSTQRSAILVSFSRYFFILFAVLIDNKIRARTEQKHTTRKGLLHFLAMHNQLNKIR